MKKRLFFPVMAYALVSIFCIGCTAEDVYDPENNKKDKEYANAFAKEFGKIDPNHTWGFGNASTRWANTEANNWGNQYVVPSPVSSVVSNESEIVTNWFKNNQNPASTNIEWSNYFAQHVSSNESYRNRMNNIYCYSEDKTTKEHLNNFNNGDQSTNSNVWNGELTIQSDQNARKTYSDKILLMLNSYTSHFSYYESTDSEDIFKYVIIPGSTIDSSLSPYYYLGFDYETTKGNIPADGYYYDWIIRLTPAVKIESRIICEDLGSIGDFDFNDAVIDVCTINQSTAITIQAAGGTLPLYIQVGNEDAFEIHEKFGVSTSTMVNTGMGVNKDVITITYENKLYTANDVIITVGNVNAQYTLHSPIGEAPQKICVSGEFSWPAERQSIKDKYPNFTKYVENQNTSWY